MPGYKQAKAGFEAVMPKCIKEKAVHIYRYQQDWVSKYDILCVTKSSNLWGITLISCKRYWLQTMKLYNACYQCRRHIDKLEELYQLCLFRILFLYEVLPHKDLIHYIEVIWKKFFKFLTKINLLSLIIFFGWESEKNFL